MHAILQAGAPQPGVSAKASLAGLGRDGLRAALAAVGVPDKQLKMRVGQLWSWIYVRGATSFDEMSDVSKELRATLARAYCLDRPEIVAGRAAAIQDLLPPFGLLSVLASTDSGRRCGDRGTQQQSGFP